MKKHSNPLLVIFDENMQRILLSSRRKTCHDGFLSAIGGEDIETENEEVDVILNEMGIRKEDAVIRHLMDVRHYIHDDESISLYVLRLNGVDPASAERKHLFWIPIPHLSVCGGLLAGSGLERLLIEYAVELVSNGRIQW